MAAASSSGGGGGGGGDGGAGGGGGGGGSGGGLKLKLGSFKLKLKKSSPEPAPAATGSAAGNGQVVRTSPSTDKKSKKRDRPRSAGSGSGSGRGSGGVEGGAPIPIGSDLPAALPAGLVKPEARPVAAAQPAPVVAPAQPKPKTAQRRPSGSSAFSSDSAGGLTNTGSVAKGGWEEEAEAVLKRLVRHPWVRNSNTGEDRFGWLSPIVERYPTLAEQYLKEVKMPICINEVDAQLKTGLMKQPAEFVTMILLVFANAIQFNYPRINPVITVNDDQFPFEVCEVAKHLGSYFTWDVMEKPKLVEAAGVIDLISSLSGLSKIGKVTPPQYHPPWLSLELSVETQRQLREEREAILFESPIEYNKTIDKCPVKHACTRLLKSLFQQNIRKHSWHFEEPVDLVANPGYKTFIEKPTSKRQVEAKFSSHQFHTMGEYWSEPFCTTRYAHRSCHVPHPPCSPCSPCHRTGITLLFQVIWWKRSV